jgi:hypothetical protein
MHDSSRIRWNPAADDLIRRTALETNVETVLDMLEPLLGRRISARSMQDRANFIGCRRTNANNRTSDWLTDKVAVWLEAQWKAGAPASRLSDRIAEETGYVIMPRVVGNACYLRWGARTVYQTGHNIHGATKSKRCLQCREWHVMPVQRFRCERCHKNTLHDYEPDSFALVGARMR